MDRREISDLYRRLGPLIYRRCLKLLGDDQKAKDATQEVFVRVLRHAKNLDQERDCLHWLYRVATNYCLNVIRDSKRLEFRAPEKIPELTRWQDVTDDLVSRERLVQLLSEHNQQTQQLVIFHYLDGMTQDEIATLMKISRKTVGKKLKAFADKVKKEFAKDSRHG